MKKDILETIQNLNSIYSEVFTINTVLDYAFKDLEKNRESDDKRLIVNIVSKYLAIRLCAYGEELLRYFNKCTVEKQDEILKQKIMMFNDFLSGNKLKDIRDTVLAHNNRRRTSNGKYDIVTMGEMETMILPSVADFNRFVKIMEEITNGIARNALNSNFGNPHTDF